MENRLLVLRTLTSIFRYHFHLKCLLNTRSQRTNIHTERSNPTVQQCEKEILDFDIKPIITDGTIPNAPNNRAKQLDQKNVDMANLNLRHQPISNRRYHKFFFKITPHTIEANIVIKIFEEHHAEKNINENGGYFPRKN